MRWVLDTLIALFVRLTELVRSLEVLFLEVWEFLPLGVVREWFASRTYVDLLLGIPAGLAAVSLMIGAIVSSAGAEPLTVDANVNRAIAAKQAEDDDLLELYLRKSQLAVGGTDQGRFNQALLLQSLGRMRETLMIMRRLAPEDRPGFVPAHQWLAQGLTRQLAEEVKKENPTETDQQLQRDLTQRIEQHYKLIVAAEPKHPIANQRLMQLRLREGDIDAVADHLSRIVDDNEELRLLYAQILARQGNENEAESEAQRALRYHQQQLSEEGLEEDAATLHRLKLSQSFLVLEDYESAATSLLAEGKLAGEDPRLRAALGNVFFLWSQSIEATNNETLARKMELLGQALALRPNDVRILYRVAMLAGDDGEAGDEARTALKEVLATGRAPAIVHFVLGVNAFERRDTESALRHWELANRINPNTPVTLNNLGVMVSRQDPPDLERAIGMVEKAIELNPNVAEFYDSRGGIYLKMERYIDAIADLEHAIQRLPRRGDIHGRLAVAYEAVGDAELAKMHQERADYFSKAAVRNVPRARPEGTNRETK